MSSFATLRTTTSGNVLTIELHRPDVLNAVNTEMLMELGAALRLAQRDEAIRCVLLTASGRGFCAGQDLRELSRLAGPDGTFDLGVVLREKYNPLILRLRTMEKPVVTAVNGVAAGAGVSFALAGDVVLAAAGATFRLAFTRIGLVPDAGVTLALVQRCGYGRAAELCLLNEPVSAADALAMNLVNRVVPDEQLREAALAIAGRLAALPPTALALTKRTLNRAWSAVLDEQLEYEAFVQTTASGSAEHRAAVASFLERKPRA